MIKRIIGKLAAAVGVDSGGAALVTSLLFMVILTALGMASIMTASTEIMVSRNYRLNILALDYANAGVQAALAKMDSTLISTNVRAYDGTGPDYFPGDPNQTWTATSNEISGVGSMDYTATISYKKEGPLHFRYMNPGNPKYDGIDDDQVVAYSQDCGYGKSPMDSLEHAFPVYVIESTGRVYSGSREMAQATVTAEVAKDTLDLKSDAAVVSGDCSNINGTAYIHGEDTGGCGDDKIGIQNNDPACVPGDVSNVTGSSQYESDAGVDLENMFGRPVDEIIGMAFSRETLTGNTIWPGLSFGDYDNPTIMYVNTDTYNFTMNNCSGYGILIVDGDLVLGGTFTWNGMVYVRGTVSMNGGGSEQNIYGTIAATGDITMNGTAIHLYYDQCKLDRIMDVAFKSKVINWVRQYDYEAAYE